MRAPRRLHLGHQACWYAPPPVLPTAVADAILAAHINWIAHDLRKAVATCPPDVELSIMVFVTSRPTSPDMPTKPPLSCAPTLASLPTLSAVPAIPATPTTPLASPTSPGSPTPTVCGDIATERRAPDRWIRSKRLRTFPRDRWS